MRPKAFHPGQGVYSFNSRTPCGVRLNSAKAAYESSKFQFTHPVWGATSSLQRPPATATVSIHAPRVGCDVGRSLSAWCSPMFQFTHPVWGATSLRRSKIAPLWFQFTHPVWGATWRSSARCWGRGFNSRTPCGVRRDKSIPATLRAWFQFTHPVWGATVGGYGVCEVFAFQFTHPVWGATHRRSKIVRYVKVSIHAPRVGCDGDWITALRPDIVFQFTHPVWGATARVDSQ